MKIEKAKRLLKHGIPSDAFGCNPNEKRKDEGGISNVGFASAYPGIIAFERQHLTARLAASTFSIEKCPGYAEA
jgi:hypothetical protein